MNKIYSYVLRYDDGAAPNPYWDICTLAICKPAIRRNAQIGDWVIGTGSKHSRCNDGITRDFSNHLVYAMKITDIKSLQDYNSFCLSNLSAKIPMWDSSIWPFKMGDCIYDFSIDNQTPVIRSSVHDERNRKRDLSGENVLMSDYFYYFGDNAQEIPDSLRYLIKRNQGHKKCIDDNLIKLFEDWVDQFEKNRIYADPQLRHAFDKPLSNEDCNQCAANHYIEDEDEQEEIITCN